ncbi:nucleotidyltransferase domain-containing protein [Niallia taxi]|uniref:nucleotidyltransferase domain-containing protein n=1 Tax=Niallia taxi TaxID=2499688 RepID=UPI00300935E4
MKKSKGREGKDKEIFSQLSEEINLLLLLLREDITDEKLKNFNVKKINWETFVQLALHHRVFPILYIKLNELKHFSIPESVMVVFQKKYQHNVFSMLQLTSEMEKLGNLFNKNDISALFLKGPILADNIYGDISLRTSKDLDILISPTDIQSTEELLLSCGYVKEEEKSILNEDRWRTHHSVFYHSNFNFSVEIHWRLNDKPDKEPTFSALWERRRTSNLTGQPINILGEEDLFLYLISHGARHGWFRLRWLLDIDRFVRKGVIWENYKKIIKEYSNEHLVGQSLILANRLLHTPIGEDLYKLLVSKSYIIADMALNFIKGSEINQSFPKELVTFHQHYIWVLQKNILQKIRYLLILSYPSYTDYQLLRLPKKVHFLYFPLRPFLFAGRKLKILKVKEN